MIVINLPAGERLQEHQVHERAWLVVAAGAVEIDDADGDTVSGGPGLLAAFDPNERHEVRATEDTRLLLLLSVAGRRPPLEPGVELVSSDEARQVRPEARVADPGGIEPGDLDPSADARPAIAPSIARRWSPTESSVPPRSPPPPATANPSSVASISAPSPRRPDTTDAIRSDSLWRSSAAPVTIVSPSAKHPARATRAARRSPAAPRRLRPSSPGGPRAGDDGRHRLVPRRGGLDDLERGAHPGQDPEQADPSGVDPDALHPDLAAAAQQGGDDEERGGREVAGNRDLARLERPVGSTVTRRAGSSPWTVTGVPASELISFGAGRPQHALGVVAGRAALDHAGGPRASRPASNRHDFTCALATGERYSTPRSSAPRTVSGGRRSSVADVGAHQPQRFDDPVDRRRRSTRRPPGVHSPAADRPANREGCASGCRRCRRR